MGRQLCRDAILPMPVICEVPCPKDCALSPWTPWSQCSHTCSGKSTEGKQTRARSILAYNAGEGRSSFTLMCIKTSSCRNASFLGLQVQCVKFGLTDFYIGANLNTHKYINQNCIITVTASPLMYTCISGDAPS